MIFPIPISPYLCRARSLSRKQKFSHLYYCYCGSADEPKLPVSAARRGSPEYIPMAQLPLIYCLWSIRGLPSDVLWAPRRWPSLISWPPHNPSICDLPQNPVDHRLCLWCTSASLFLQKISALCLLPFLTLSSKPDSFLQPAKNSLPVALSYAVLHNAQPQTCQRHSLNPLLYIGIFARVCKDLHPAVHSVFA